VRDGGGAEARVRETVKFAQQLFGQPGFDIIGTHFVDIEVGVVTGPQDWEFLLYGE
jgi:hypothetical protein